MPHDSGLDEVWSRSSRTFLILLWRTEPVCDHKLNRSASRRGEGVYMAKGWVQATWEVCGLHALLVGFSSSPGDWTWSQGKPRSKFQVHHESLVGG